MKNRLAEVSDFRYSGIQMNNRLKFESHINNVCSRLSKFNGLLIKGGNYFSKNVLVKFYNCYAKPIILYGLIAFGATSKSLLEKLFVMENVFLKLFVARENLIKPHISYILLRLKPFLTFVSDKYSKKLLISFVVKLPSKLLTWNL